MPHAATEFLTTIQRALGGDAKSGSRVEFTGEGALPSVFAITDLAAGSIGAAALAVLEYADAGAAMTPAVSVDRRLASFWFGSSVEPIGWSLPPVWHVIAGDYACADGWIRLHTNAARHREAALAVLATAGDKEAVRAAVKRWQADELEAAVVARGGCAATMRSLADWSAHPQGKLVASEPLVWLERTEKSAPCVDARDRARPLAGVRVLDLTRILAGPIATRFLAGFGAEVLRIRRTGTSRRSRPRSPWANDARGSISTAPGAENAGWCCCHRPTWSFTAIAPTRWNGSASASRRAAARGRD
jgi:CoA-transferase family III